MKINISAENKLKSPIAEAFRSFRTNIQFSNIDKSLKCLAVTSSVPGEGKSTICFNLAVSIAQTEKRVLLVDTDLRKPTIHSFFEPKHNKGVTNIIAQEMDYREVLQWDEKISKLDIITSGPIPPNPSEILGSLRMKNLVKELRKEYDMIIMDSPPIGLVTDAAVLSTVADGVILVCASGKTKREELSKSISSLSQVNANILGIVMNKVKYKKNSKYSTYY